MKHPGYEVLQDYFENALDLEIETKVKVHLNQCDQCTNMLAQFVQIESKIKEQRNLVISQFAKNKTLVDAKRLLANKRKQIQDQEAHKENMKLYLQNWKETIFPELKTPALQLCSLSLVLATFVAVEQLESRKEEYYKPFSDEVSVFTHKEVL